MNFIWVACGGALGAMLRFALGMAVAFPYGTLSVNVIGSFVIGVAYVMLSGMSAANLFIITGLLGGFTTFSAFSLDVMKLIELGRIGSAMLYVVASVGLSLLAVYLGVLIARGLS